MTDRNDPNIDDFSRKFLERFGQPKVGNKRVDLLVRLLPSIDQAIRNGYKTIEVLRFIADDQGWSSSDMGLRTLLARARRKAKVGVK